MNPESVRTIAGLLFPDPPAPTEGFTLEVGKSYIRRDGRQSGVLVKNANAEFPFRDALNLWWYREDGTSNIIQTFDLIKEYKL